jgi:Ca-activated chloride channel family protein
MKGSHEACAAARTSVVACALVLGLGGCDTRGTGQAPVNAQPAEPAATVAHSGPGRGKEGTPTDDKSADLGLGLATTAASASAPPSPPGFSPRPSPVVGQGGGSGARAPLADVPTMLPVAPAQKLDPNARYATTYRPGGAALAAFDAAVSRGQIPASYKDLVGDFGARYAPSIARPSSGALAVAVDTERAAIGPNGGPMNLRVSLVSSEATPSRAQLSVHIVLDTSGSMSGQSIRDARQAAEAVVSKLAPTDDFSMVTFSDSAHLLVGDGPIGPRRADTLARIERVEADGGTNISSGLDLGYQEAHDAAIPADAVRIVMLLSDGHANGGDTSPQSLADRAARAFQDGIQTSSFGLGTDFDAALMSRIADRGAGGYYYLADSTQITPALAREIDARLQPVATAVEVRVRLRPDISATRVFGSRELSTPEAAAVRAQEVAIDQQEQRKGIKSDRQTDAEGGMRFFIPAFARADRHATMLTLALPAGTGERGIASVEVRYKDRVLGKNVTQEMPVKMRWADSDAASAKTEDPSVERMALAFAAGETILAAAERVDAGDRGGATRMLDERAEVLRIAASTLSEPMLAEDGARLARLSVAVGGGTSAVSDPLPLVVMLRGSGYGYL